METASTNVELLASNWSALTAGLLERNTLDYPLFKATFSETFALLSPCRKESAIDKSLLRLILNAHQFVRTDCSPVDSTPPAAAILTERMLQFCLLSSDSGQECATGSTIYIIQNRQEIFVDFLNIERSIERLVQVLNNQFWDTV